MIKVYAAGEQGKVPAPDGWDYPPEEIGYLVYEHEDGAEFVLMWDGRLHEAVDESEV